MDVDPPFDPMLDGGGLDDLAPPYVPPAPSPELAGSARPSLLRPGTVVACLLACAHGAYGACIVICRAAGALSGYGSLNESPWQARGRGSKGRKRSGGPVMDEELAISKKVLVSNAWCTPDGVTSRLCMHAMTSALRAIGRRQNPMSLVPVDDVA